jgi:hypothetical protein
MPPQSKSENLTYQKLRNRGNAMNGINKLLGIFAITSLLLASCGGGGGGGGSSGPVVSTQSFNVKTAITTDDAMPHSYNF